VLVLDDPLSALDVHTEAEVEAALRRVLCDVTALVVAHRPSTVQLADRVALLAGGRIAAVGTHSELLAEVPEYRRLLSTWMPRRSPDDGGGPMTQAWRGVAAEDLDTIDAETGLRLATRSRRLLGSLLRPRLSRVSAALDGRPTPLTWCIAGYAMAGALDALAASAFVRLWGRIGADVLLDLRERVFGQIQRLSLAFHDRYTSGRVISRLTSDLDSLQEMLNENLDGFFVSLLSIVGIGAVLMVLDAPLTLGVLAAFVFYLRRFYDPLDELAMFANSYASAAAALEKISGVLEERAGVGDPIQPVALPVPVRGEVVFDRVRFSYGDPVPSRSSMVLPQLELVVPAGQTVALVGATGAGKSTVAKLLARFYDPVAGAVRLDGSTCARWPTPTCTPPGAPRWPNPAGTAAGRSR
jgi:ABC-type multidrug transport system fused ATPase/permease subunit